MAILAEKLKIDKFNYAATILLCLLLTYIIVLVRTAWLCDDSYITLRTVDNFVNGMGLRWNPLERVQAYTNPLWMFVLSAIYFFTRQAYLTTLGLSMAASVAAVYVVAWKLPASRSTALLGIAVLIASKAFMDFSTSGLENPLTHLLFALYALVYFKDFTWSTEKRVLILSLIASLGLLNRLDTALVFFPPLAYELYKTKSRRTILLTILGMTPLMVWEIFSIIYYGLPFPNTAYAKLGISNIETTAIIMRGFSYLRESFFMDPVTLIFIFAVLAIVFVRSSGKSVAVASGLLLYLLYVVRIGGGFMSGRFLALPLFGSICLLVSTRAYSKRVLYIGLAMVVALGALGKYPPILSGPDYGMDRGELSYLADTTRLGWSNPGSFIQKGFITDERGFYYQMTGLLSQVSFKPYTDIKHIWADKGKVAKSYNLELVTGKTIGFLGFYAGPKVHIIDRLALADPLLARLPALNNSKVNLGHFLRKIPKGYTDSILDGINRIENKQIARLYDNILLVTRGDLFSLERFEAIMRLNFTDYELPMDPEEYETSGVVWE